MKILVCYHYWVTPPHASSFIERRHEYRDVKKFSEATLKKLEVSLRKEAVKRHRNQFASKRYQPLIGDVVFGSVCELNEMITAENLKKAKGILKQRGHDVIADVKGLDLTDGDQRRLLERRAES